MTYPMFKKDPNGIYSEEEKKQLVVVIKSGKLPEVVKFLQENAVMDSFGKNALDYVSTKTDQLLDVITLNGKIDVNYANTTQFEKYYYSLRIAGFTIKSFLGDNDVN